MSSYTVYVHREITLKYSTVVTVNAENPDMALDHAEAEAREHEEDLSWKPIAENRDFRGYAVESQKV